MNNEINGSMYVIDTTDGTHHEVVIEPIQQVDHKKIKASKEFQFNWEKYKNQEIYKIRLKSAEVILGLIHIIPHPEEGYHFLEITLIEASKTNRGKNKKYDRVGGCLLAFACRQSIIRDCTGYVMLVAKTNKVSVFEGYGFISIGSVAALGVRMASKTENTERLIKEYYEQ